MYLLFSLRSFYFIPNRRNSVHGKIFTNCFEWEVFNSFLTGATQYTSSLPLPNSICGNRFTSVTNGVSLVKTICSKFHFWKAINVITKLANLILSMIFCCRSRQPNSVSNLVRFRQLGVRDWNRRPRVQAFLFTHDLPVELIFARIFFLSLCSFSSLTHFNTSLY